MHLRSVHLHTDTYLSAIDDIHRLANELGLRVVENTTTGELYRTYRGRPTSSAIFQHYSICTLER